ncbi:MAG: hypothetical protein K2L45_06610, partial [Muribaculaceae bacterium]|nr:hypothetical protein [Muribaculaceae bacterium]
MLAWTWRRVRRSWRSEGEVTLARGLSKGVRRLRAFSRRRRVREVGFLKLAVSWVVISEMVVIVFGVGVGIGVGALGALGAKGFKGFKGFKGYRG